MNSSLPILEQGYVTPDASSTRSSGQQPMDQTPQTPSKLPDKDIERNSIYSNDVPWAHPERLADVRRGLKQRHIHMFALAGTIGKFLWKHARPCTGLFLSSGKALAEAGPLGAFLGYTVMGLITAAVAYTASEMSAFSPVSGGFVRHTTKFVDPVLGAVTGWNFWYSMAITAVVELCPNGLINLGPVRVYGEVEFGFALLKITLIVVLLLVGLVITAGGGPTHESIGFRYWRDPGPFRQEVAGGSFLAVWSTLINAAFAYGNIQVVAMQGVRPRIHAWQSQRPSTRPSLGCTVYISSVFMIGLLLPSTEPLLLGGDGTAAQSPFVIAMHRARIRVLPDIVNAVVLSSAFSSGVSCIFIASRSLIGLAEDGNAPVIFSRTNRLGNPWVAVMCSSAFGALGYLSVTEKSMKVLLWLINLSAVAGLAQGYTRDDLPYRAPFQPFTAWFALVMVILITFFSGFRVFLTGQFSVADFLSNYVNIFVFLGLYITWKLYTRDRQIYRPATKVDLSEFEAIRQEREQNLTTLPTRTTTRSSRRQRLFICLC
ncbi:amino acid permease [Rhizoctonia solani]|uniref:Amino acid permease n=1 Tax=Rhizoctonia solani TaxID=456999 RepID=A0A8H8P581_9AGAM|nr:amino acid permease [Rhizoctonia solani]QRW25400.1 amino acid permease [Rhizoctonia solani]